MTQPTEEQKSRVIFEALKLGECWHEFSIYTPIFGHPRCRCGLQVSRMAIRYGIYKNPNYFARDLPDNIRVDMVTAAFDRWGMLPLMTAAGYIDGQKSLRQPASVIAEAIYTLIQEQNDGNN